MDVARDLLEILTEALRGAADRLGPAADVSSLEPCAGGTGRVDSVGVRFAWGDSHQGAFLAADDAALSRVPAAPMKPAVIACLPLLRAAAPCIR